MSNVWSSNFGFLIAVAGAAIGLGNIWKFPYMVGENGGGAFVIVYIICVLCFGLPLMIAEMLLGKISNSDPIKSFKVIVGNKYQYSLGQAGWLFVVTALLMLSFYTVISGFAVGYLYKIITGQLDNLSVIQVLDIWQGFTNNPMQLIICNIIFLFFSAWIVAAGVVKGLERANKLLIPALYGMLIILFIYAMQQDGFGQALEFILGFRIDDINIKVVVAALGHALFSLAVGAGCLLVYGSYLPKVSSLSSVAVWVAGLSIVVALLSGVAIYTVIFSYDLSIAQGPGLMFETLPIAFAKMHYGYWIGIIFFLILLFAAITSTISFIEVLVAAMTSKYDCSRLTAVILICCFAFILGIGTILSFNWYKQPLLLGRNFFYLITDLVTNILLPCAGMIIALVAGWFIKAGDARDSISSKYFWLYWGWQQLLRYLVPTIILVIMYWNFVNS